MNEKEEAVIYLNEYIKNKLQVELEVNVDNFNLGFIKGFVEGFKRASQIKFDNDIELAIITKIVLKDKTIDEIEFCKVIKTENKNE